MPGLPKKYIKKYGVSKRAWREYRKTKAGRKSASKTKSRSNPSRSTNRRTRRSTKRKVKSVGKRRGFLTTSTFMKFARLFALAAPAAAVAMGPGDPQAKIKEGVRVYTGFDMNNGGFSLQNLAQGWLPFLATSVATVGISKLNGMIRRL